MVRKDEGADNDKVTGGVPVTEAELPPARRTGLIVVVAALLLLLVAGVAGAMLLVPAFRGGKIDKGPDAASKARIEVAIGVMKALRINDLAAVKPFLVDSAQDAITDAQWTEAAEASEVASATFSPTTWSGDASATVDFTIDGGTGTMAFAVNPDKRNVVTMTESGSDGELIYDVELTQVGSGWRAVALTPRAEPFNLDEEFVKSLVEVPAE